MKPKSKKRNEKNNEKKILSIILLLLAFICLILFLTPEQEIDLSSVAHNVGGFLQHQDKINLHMSLTEKQILLKQQQTDLQNTLTAPVIGDSIFSDKLKKTYMEGVDMSSDRNEASVIQDLRSKPELHFERPDQIIQGELLDKESGREFQESYRQVYAKQFVENARRGGYEVVLDDNFVVVSVRKLKKDPPQRLFNSEGSVRE